MVSVPGMEVKKKKKGSNGAVSDRPKKRKTLK